LRQIKAIRSGDDKNGLTSSERHVSHYIESLGTKSLDTASLDMTSLDTASLGLPAARTPGFVRHLYRSTRMLLRSIIARIDLSQFPGSCCG
jgi:hypothetical protein